jgi:hypothetical protein
LRQDVSGKEGQAVNRTDLQRLVKQRIREAKALLAAKCWPGAYYLAGYAVECALKSCILARVERTGFIFVDRKYAEKCWTHNLTTLAELADLQQDMDSRANADPDFYDAWLVVREWDETSRYSRKTRPEATQLYAAITDAKHGVLTWIKHHW